MARKLKLAKKANIAEPIEIDEVRLISAELNLRDGLFSAKVALIDSDGGDNGQPIVKEERPIHMGLVNIAGIDIDALEEAILRNIAGSGVVPNGTVE